uniref:ADP,ATP carrier protein n=1 Tax=Heterosigma akashiwo TaxID=2829 RepID=A0A6V1LEJ0_HETAK|mmetsp:Transcript_50544/g.86948  ORF Transcript_50544/g.86948 Transcript_50544/m.86948 type:complete len:555 (-) Transcript_50544:313-1977(-)|eukprot:CAMPEP_0206382428 /NCGR_PEP_ID=MMETSP0294-20121207/13264_1 /ASSEMBLY_ACC=CAM_ASM_000327 /TAXON_ID=39354 /ORGANISM="Heterosigma akashiwo, Strain CCMP2393" /LENGTH=554 /DNA_ID=CAMNT_0053832127 /DNA_START=120 /DNA_END=1784 /DNA_ORIENTATION=-
MGVKTIFVLLVVAILCYSTQASNLPDGKKSAYAPSLKTATTPKLFTHDLTARGGGEASEQLTFMQKLKAQLPTKAEKKKILPLGLMFFLILFNYTILRDTKDVLVVTAPASGAEIIPFLKTYVNLPGAILFTILYSWMNNRMNPVHVFYWTILPFVAFFGAFSLFIYPARDLLHPNAFADWLTDLLPAGFMPLIAIVRNWTYALFYTMAELWGSVVVSVLFWGFSNEVTSVAEAKKYYPLFGMGANVALIFSGQYVKLVSKLREGMPEGVDKWGVSLKLLTGAVVLFGLCICGIFNHMQKNVVTDPECVSELRKPKSKASTSMSLGESAKYLASSPYIRYLALLVISYGMSINIVEVTWKGKLKAQYPDPNGYSAFMGNFSTATGTITLFMMILGRFIFQKFGWGTAALVTPTVLFITGGLFFSLILFGDFFKPLLDALGTTPLFAAVIAGAAQNILSKSSKYSLFDPCKEMAYIPLDAEQRVKGKAAVDVIGNPLGKSGGSFVQQFMIFAFGSLAASTPYLAIVLVAIVSMWIYAAKALNKLFIEAMAKSDRA